VCNATMATSSLYKALVVAVAFSTLALAVPTPASLGSDLQILLHNDLYGKCRLPLLSSLSSLEGPRQREHARRCRDRTRHAPNPTGSSERLFGTRGIAMDSSLRSNRRQLPGISGVPIWTAERLRPLVAKSRRTRLPAVLPIRSQPRRGILHRRFR